MSATVNKPAGIKEDQAEQPILKEVSVAGFMRSAKPHVGFAVETIIPEQNVTLLGGHGDAGKSMLALTLAAHVAAGRQWNALDVDAGQAVFVSMEDPADLVLYRLRRIACEYDLPETALESAFRLIDGSDSDSALAREVSEFGPRRLVETAALAELRNIAESKPRLIVIDNASDAYDGDENVRKQVRSFIRSLAQLARSSGAAVLLLAHVDKSAARGGGSGNSYSGSTAWHNSVRSRLALVHTDDSIELRHEKHNLTVAAPTLALEWSNDGVLVPAPGRIVSAQPAQPAGAKANDYRRKKNGEI